MTVIISDSSNAAYDGNLSKANGFYRVEAHQLSAFGSNGNGLSLATPRTISVTFANAGNCKGAIICLTSFVANIIGVPSSFRSVTVELQELVAAVWTTRASKTLTAAEITNNSTGVLYGAEFIQPFQFTAPYAVDTTAGKWRLQISNASGGQQWLIRCGDSGNTVPFYATWCDTQVSANDNDVLIVKDDVTIDKSITLTGIVNATDATNSVACIVCKSDSAAAASVCKLKWAASPAASYTLTLKGLMVLEAYSGIQVGMSAARIPYANKAVIDIQAATAGTATITGFTSFAKLSNSNSYRQNYFFYGEIPAVKNNTYLYDIVKTRTCTLSTGTPGIVALVASVPNGSPIRFTTTGSLPTGVTVGTVYWTRNISGANYNIAPTRADALAGTNLIAISGTQSGTHTAHGVVYTTSPTGWSVGNRVALSKRAQGAGIYNATTNISYISGTEIWLDSVPDDFFLSASTSLMGEIWVIDGYGVVIKRYTNGAHIRGLANNFELSGVEVQNELLFLTVQSNQALNDFGFLNRHYIGDCVFHTSTTNQSLFNTYSITAKGLTLENCLFNGVSMAGSTRASIKLWSGFGDASMTDKYSVIYRNNTHINLSQIGVDFNGVGFLIVNNRFYNPASNTEQWYLTLGSAYGLFSTEVSGNYFWGSAGAIFGIANTSDMIWQNDKFENNSRAVTLIASKFPKIKGSNIIFGAEKANTYDVAIADGVAPDIEFESPTGNLIADTTLQDSMIQGSSIRFTDENDTANKDRIIKRTGFITRCGTGLADTTAHNGGFSVRFQSISSTYALDWTQNVPTANIQNKSMMVGVWVNIANAAYYAGTKQLPRITVNYDNGTVVYGEALAQTGWQFVFVPFTPTTTYGQIAVALTTMTDASGTNAYVYFDDMSVLYPAGHTIALGNFDLWANALPVTPSISTSVSAADVWAANPAQFGANTAGDKLNSIKTDTGLIPALL